MNRFQLGYLRCLGFLEGSSLLFLLFVAMPAKRILHDSHWVQSAGALHGVLFLMYAYTLLVSAREGGWGVRATIRGVTLSCLPFGSFWFDRTVLKRAPVRPTQAEKRQTETGKN